MSPAVKQYDLVAGADGRRGIVLRVDHNAVHVHWRGMRFRETARVYADDIGGLRVVGHADKGAHEPPPEILHADGSPLAFGEMALP